MNEANNPLIPPATFEFLVASLRFQAEMNLSGGPAQEGEEPEGPNLPLVRHFIDMLAMLLEKTKGNLTLDEQRALENTLTELRFRYIQVFDQEKRKAEKAAEAAQG
jgi:hypothetical protein